MGVCYGEFGALNHLSSRVKTTIYRLLSDLRPNLNASSRVLRSFPIQPPQLFFLLRFRPITLSLAALHTGTTWTEQSQRRQVGHISMKLRCQTRRWRPCLTLYAIWYANDLSGRPDILPLVSIVSGNTGHRATGEAPGRKVQTNRP